MVATTTSLRPALLRALGLYVVVLGYLSGAVPIQSEESPSGPQLSRQECLQQALDQNPKIQKAREEIKRTKGMILEARAGALPSVSTSGQFGYEDRNRAERMFEGLPLENEKLWTVSLRVKQTLFSAGKVGAAMSIARLTEETSILELQRVIDDVSLAVHKSHSAVLLQQGLTQVAQQSISLLEEELENQKRKERAGASTRFNVLRAEVELANARPPLIRAQNAERMARAELATLIGRKSNGIPDINPTLQIKGELEPANLSLSLSQLLESAFARRPELLACSKQIKIQQQQLRIDRSSRYPTFGVFGGYDWTGNRYGEFGDESNGSIAGVQGEWNLFDGFLSQGKMDQTESRIRQITSEEDSLRRSVEIEVRKAYSQWTEAGAVLQSQVKNIESAQEALRLARARLNAGAGTQLDVLSCQVALTQARTNELQARHDSLVSLAELQRAASLVSQFRDDLTFPAPKN